MRIAISNIADKFKLKFKRLFYAQGPEVNVRERLGEYVLKPAAVLRKCSCEHQRETKKKKAKVHLIY